MELATHQSIHDSRQLVFGTIATLLFSIFGPLVSGLLAGPSGKTGRDGTCFLCSSVTRRVVDLHVDVGVHDGRNCFEKSFLRFFSLFRAIHGHVSQIVMDQLGMVDTDHGVQLSLRSRQVSGFVGEFVQLGMEYLPVVSDESQ
jgi:hypothetical protein